MKQLFFGDCLDVLKDLHAKEPKGFIDLIYIDPPFNSKRNYNILFESIDMNDSKAQREAFSDTWTNVTYNDSLRELQNLNLDLYNFLVTLQKINISASAVSYLTTMAIRIYFMHKVLKDTGSFYLHCDPNMSHYLKIVCDIIGFYFLSEITWQRTKAHSDSKNFANTNDIILFFTKSPNYLFNIQYQTYSKDYIDKYYIHEEENRRFLDRDLTAGGLSGGGYNYEWNGINKIWRCPIETMRKLHEENKLYYTKNGTPRLKQYLDEMPGVAINNNWTDIPPINSQAQERLGYPTQKPEALLERIIKASSNEGDLVADFFCGCGTTIAVANRLNRNWLGADISHLAIKLILDRMTKPLSEESRKAFMKEVEVHGFPKDIDSAKELARKDHKGRFEFQAWVVEFLLGGILNPKMVADGGWDGYLTFNKNEKERGTVLIEVKSGGVNVKMLKEFCEVVRGMDADIGVFVCFADEVTKPMREWAAQAGNYAPYRFDKIQILTIEDIFAGKTIQMPFGIDASTFKTAVKDVRPDNNKQGKMF